MIEWLRDKTRDNLARDLNSLGITTILANRGRPEEKIEKARFQNSLGVIDIPEGLVRWVNVLKQSGENGSQWWIVFGMPDEKAIPQTVNIKTVRKKTVPLFGQVIDVTWEGDDSTTGLIDILSSDEDIKNMAEHIGNLTIRSHTNEFRGWTLQVDRRFKPTAKDWATIQKIAKDLLSSTHKL